MATQADVIEDLVETLEDGKEGFSRVAEKLREDGHEDLASKMAEYSEQRARFAGELRTFAASAGDEIDEEGSAAGALHRGWISLKDALTGNDPHAVLASAEEGEDHAVEEYEDALDEEDLADELRDLISRQAAEVKAAHDQVRNLRDRFEG
jgi:uncharacterized protein (TIGR02284 family)